MSYLKKLRQLFKHRKAVATYLDFRDRPGDAYWGSVRDEEVGFLTSLVEKANHLEGPILEVGTLFGFSTQIMASVKSTEKPLITVDNLSWNPLGLRPEDHQFFLARTLYQATRSQYVDVRIEDIDSFYMSYDGLRPSMIFIDADHRYEAVKRDIAWARELGIPIISGHDYSTEHPGVQRAVKEAFSTEPEVHGTLWAQIN